MATSVSCRNGPCKVTVGASDQAAFMICSPPGSSRRSARGRRRTRRSRGSRRRPRQADLEPAVAEAVEGGDRAGEVHRVVLRADEHRHAEPEPLGARCRVGQQLQGRDERGRADRLLDRPARLEPELLGPGQEGTDSGAVERVGGELRDRDREAHASASGRPGRERSATGAGRPRARRRWPRCATAARPRASWANSSAAGRVTRGDRARRAAAAPAARRPGRHR